MIKPKKLIVMIPCLNEEKTLPLVIKSIPKKIPGISTIKVLVINDGSTDNSVKIAKKLKAYVISHPFNCGLGQTFRDGIDKALRLGADIIVNIDGDMQLNPKDIPKLVEPIINNKVNFVTGTRYKEYLEHNLKGRGIKNFGNKFFAKLINIITNSNYTDVSCGFRAYSRKAAMKLQLFGHFTYTHETFLDLIHKGFVAVEVPIKVKPKRSNGKSKISGNLIKYGNSALKIIIRGSRDHQPLKFFGILSLIIFFIGFAFGVFLIIVKIKTGMLSPFKSFGFISGFLIGISFLMFIVALLADMLGRVKDLEEEILYNLKKNNYK